MQAHHWGLLAVVFVAGVLFARFFPQLPKAIGLP